MILITKAIEKLLEQNNANHDSPDNKPVLKLFSTACTWLISESDGDTLYGLCDLGMGSPELGYVSLSELKEVRVGSFGLPIERDKFFKANKTLREYTNDAKAIGYIAA